MISDHSGYTLEAKATIAEGPEGNKKAPQDAKALWDHFVWGTHPHDITTAAQYIWMSAGYSAVPVPRCRKVGYPPGKLLTVYIREAESAGLEQSGT